MALDDDKPDSRDIADTECYLYGEDIRDDLCFAEDVQVERVEVWRDRSDPDGLDLADENKRLAACQKALGYAFRDHRLLARALTHSSSTADKTLDNERMEFFGDAVLDLVVREYLFHHYPNRQEGDLTEAKSAIVCRASLVRAAHAIQLKKFLILGRGLGRKRKIPESLLADAFEAVVAAIYLDAGYGAARKFIMRTLGTEIPTAIERVNVANFKSNLQKLIQQRRRSLPIYRVLGSSGPEHSRIFEVAAMVDGKEMGRGAGSSKKTAEQEAARRALENIKRTGMEDEAK